MKFIGLSDTGMRHDVEAPSLFDAAETLLGNQNPVHGVRVPNTPLVEYTDGTMLCWIAEDNADLSNVMDAIRERTAQWKKIRDRLHP